MRSLRVPAASLVFAAALTAEPPYYTPQSLVNSADNQPGELAPNVIATLYGANLAYGTKILTPDDIRGGVLPTTLPGTGVRILLNGLPANVYYISPTQINFIVPANLLPGSLTVQLVIDGLAGPPISVQLARAAPALFQLDAQTPVATRADGSIITRDAPAQPGELAVLYATGLGQTVPPVEYGLLPRFAAPLQQLSSFQVWLDGVPVDSGNVPYAGIAPGFGGLYQVNVVLPREVAPNPEIRIAIGDAISVPGLHLPVKTDESETRN